MIDLHSAIDLGQIAVWYHLGGLVTDTNLEASWAPINELNCALGLEMGNSCVDFLGNDITTVKETCRHVFAVTRITLDHLVVWLEARAGYFRDGVGLVGCLGSRDDRCVGDEWEVNTWVGHQIGLELVQINVERAIEAERGGN